MISNRRPMGLIPLSLFFALGAIMSGLAAVTLMIPHSVLDPIWHLNPQGHEALLGLGPWAIGLMMVVSVACGAACLGLLRGTAWGRIIALTLLAMNLVGDVSTTLYRGDLRTLIGLPIGVALIGYLLSSRVRIYFQRGLHEVATFDDKV